MSGALPAANLASAQSCFEASACLDKLVAEVGTLTLAEGYAAMVPGLALAMAASALGLGVPGRRT